MMDRGVVIVTGASTGFGRLIAQTLARSGYRVFATMRDIGVRNAAAAAQVAALASAEGLALEALEIDVTQEDSVSRAVGTVLERCARLDVVVNNAGYAILDLLETVTTEQARDIFETNFFGALRMNRAALPAMRRQGSGLLLHISSGAGRLAIPGMGMYSASKFALEALAEVYRYELAALGIDSVVIEPGPYPTPIMSKFIPGGDGARRSGYGPLAGLPAQVGASLSSSRGDPQEVADCVLRIIEMPAGERPLRNRVSAGNLGVSRINAVTDEVQAQVLDAFGMTEATRFRRR